MALEGRDAKIRVNAVAPGLVDTASNIAAMKPKDLRNGPGEKTSHRSFWREGYRAVMVTDTAFYGYRHYHRNGYAREAQLPRHGTGGNGVAGSACHPVGAVSVWPQGQLIKGRV
ncbi:MAG: hypothetical protein ACREVK_04370 [Gammaproteobacteria bacterium]